MKKVLFKIPTMWADHHVSQVIEALQGLAGVKTIEASAARWEVVVEFDPTVTSVEAIGEALGAAGYPVTGVKEL